LRQHRIDRIDANHKILDYRSYSFCKEKSRFKTSSETDVGKDLNRTYRFNQSLRKKIARSPWTHKPERILLLDKSDKALGEADDSFSKLRIQEGKGFLEVANLLTDAALSLTPGVGWAKDIYEAFSGKALVGGEKLDTVNHSMAFFGAMTFGIGSKLKILFRPVMMIAGILKGSKVGRLVRSAKKGEGLFGDLAKVAKGNLNSQQLSNLNRFQKKLPAGSNPVTLHKNGANTVFQGVVPGKVPGSKAIYEKVVDSAGKTTAYTKTTYAPNGKVVHIKNKIDGSVIVPE
jgi:hypothetical protein